MAIFVDHFNIDCLLEMLTEWWWVGRDGFIWELEAFFEIVGLKIKNKSSSTSKSQCYCFELKHWPLKAAAFCVSTAGCVLTSA